MRGQMVFEFIVAAALFFGIVFYVITYLSGIVSTYSNDFAGSSLENKVLQISEFLVHSGLSDRWPVLNSTKMAELNLSCSADYAGLLQKLELENYKIRIQINETGNTNPLVECGPDLSRYAKVNVKRFALSESGSKLVMDLWAW